MEKWVSLLLLLCVFLMNPVHADTRLQDCYTAVFCSPEFKAWWDDPKCHVNLVYASKHWSNFEDFLKKVKENAHGKPIIIDLAVHGNDDGLALTQRRYHYDVTSMGYVVKKLNEHLGNQPLTVLCESCFAGNAYYYTIRNNKDKDLDFNAVPPFPIYGTGSGFSNWGSTVYLQTKENVKYYYEDLRKYENAVPAKHEIETHAAIDGGEAILISDSTKELKDLYEFYIQE